MCAHRPHEPRANRVFVLVAVSLLAGASTSILFPQGGTVLLTPEQARKIDPDLLAKIRELPPDAPLKVWFNLRPGTITSTMLEELSALGAEISLVDDSIGAIAAEILVSDLPKFASLPYIGSIQEVGQLVPT